MFTVGTLKSLISPSVFKDTFRTRALLPQCIFIIVCVDILYVLMNGTSQLITIENQNTVDQAPHPMDELQLVRRIISQELG